jgi:exonuclease III
MKQNGGLVMLVSSTYEHKVKSHTILKQGSTTLQNRCIQRLTLGRGPLALEVYNVYTPSGAKEPNNRFVDKYIKMIQSESKRKSLILRGDWNATPKEGEWWSNYSKNMNNDRRGAIQMLISSKKLIDLH